MPEICLHCCCVLQGSQLVMQGRLDRIACPLLGQPQQQVLWHICLAAGPWSLSAHRHAGPHIGLTAAHNGIPTCCHTARAAQLASSSHGSKAESFTGNREDRGACWWQRAGHRCRQINTEWVAKQHVYGAVSGRWVGSDGVTRCKVFMAAKLVQ
jgi:hypothetical protein